MAAIAESGLRNLRGEDYHGFFGMHVSLGAGVYRGFPDDPELQLRWFLDSAAGRPASAGSPRAAGPRRRGARVRAWVADVERPAPENRSRYQQYLGDARR